jgi:hypothetical protein
MQFIIGLFLLFLLSCSATETDSGEMITGQVQNSNKDALDSVKVIMRYSDDGNTILKKPVYSAPGRLKADTTYSDHDGNFRFENPGSSEFYFELNSSDTLAAFVELQNVQDVKSIILPEIICTSPGSIEGKIDESTVKDVDFLYIRVLDLTIPVDSSGYYKTHSIPSGKYTLQMIKNGEIAPSFFDTTKIVVNSKDISGVSFRSDSVLFDINQQTLALWSFNQQVNGNYFDLSPNHHILKPFNGISMQPGMYSTSIVLKDNAACIGDSSMSFKTGLIDIEAVIYISKLPESLNNDVALSMIVSNTDFGGNSNYGYELRIADTTGHLEFIIGTKDNWQYVKSNRTLTVNKWHKVRGLFNGASLSLSVDGENWGELAYNGIIQYTTKACLSIGRRYLDRPFYFNGKIDEIRISDPAK